MDATVCVGRDRRCSSSVSAGVRQPSVLRGLLLSVAATASSSSAVCLARLVPLGKYWRSRPLVSALLELVERGSMEAREAAERLLRNVASLARLAQSATERGECSGRVHVVAEGTVFDAEPDAEREQYVTGGGEPAGSSASRLSCSTIAALASSAGGHRLGFAASRIDLPNAIDSLSGCLPTFRGQPASRTILRLGRSASAASRRCR